MESNVNIFAFGNVVDVMLALMLSSSVEILRQNYTRCI